MDPGAARACTAVLQTAVDRELAPVGCWQPVLPVTLLRGFLPQWIPVTKLGRLVKDMKIKSLEEIYLFSLPIKVSGRERRCAAEPSAELRSREQLRYLLLEEFRSSVLEVESFASRS